MDTSTVSAPSFLNGGAGADIGIEHAEMILKFQLTNHDVIVEAIYQNAGTKVAGYGTVTVGYGGGIDMDAAIKLIWLDGYFGGMALGSKPKLHAILWAINTYMLAKYPNEPGDTGAKGWVRPLNENTVPFFNLSKDLVLQGIAEIQLPEAGGASKKPLGVVPFGAGNVVVCAGVYVGSPAVFVAPSPIAGKVGEEAPEGMVPRDRVVQGEYVMTFPTDAQAVVEALLTPMSVEPNPALICTRCRLRRDRHDPDFGCKFYEDPK
jgi:hypothetical protein